MGKPKRRFSIKSPLQGDSFGVRSCECTSAARDQNDETEKRPLAPVGLAFETRVLGFWASLPARVPGSFGAWTMVVPGRVGPGVKGTAVGASVPCCHAGPVGQ